MKNLVIYCDLDGVLVDYKKAIISRMQNLHKEDPKLYKDYCLRLGHSGEDGNIFDGIDGREWLINTFGAKGKKLGYRVGKDLPAEWWANLDFMPDGKQLWNYIKPFNPLILSAPADSDECRKGKRIWVSKNLDVDPKRVILDSSKHTYVHNNKGLESSEIGVFKILIDDTPKKVKGFNTDVSKGILHKNTSSTIQEVEKLLELLSK